MIETQVHRVKVELKAGAHTGGAKQFLFVGFPTPANVVEALQALARDQFDENDFHDDEVAHHANLIELLGLVDALPVPTPEQRSFTKVVKVVGTEVGRVMVEVLPAWQVAR